MHGSIPNVFPLAPIDGIDFSDPNWTNHPSRI
jgi:hypothetical protein